MKKNLLKTLFVLATCSMIFSSCSKENDLDNFGFETYENENYLLYLTVKDWDLVSDTKSNQYASNIDLLANQPDCKADDKVTFLNDYNTMETEGAISCSDGPNIMHIGEWEFANDRNNLIWDNVTYNIQTLTENTLVLKENGYNNNGSYTRIRTFKYD